MKKIFSVLITLVMVLSLTLVMAVPVAANDESSSTMIFEGALTPEVDGYIGTIDMTAGTYYVPGGGGALIGDQGGFDVYAKEGGTAYVQGMDPDNWPIGSDHDAYSEAGPWGSWYDPDCEDWGQYSLELTAGHWYLRYTSSSESPMSGTLVWNGTGTSGYASETDLGTQDGGHDGSAIHGGGEQAWDWDCGWGVEVIPLQFPGFEVTVEDLEGGNYKVTMTPADAPSSVGLATTVKGILGIRVNPTIIDFGSLYPGQPSAKHPITVANIGTVNCNVSTLLDPTGTVFDNLFVGAQGVPYSDLIVALEDGLSQDVDVQLVVPLDYPPGGTETATLIFEAATQ